MEPPDEAREKVVKKRKHAKIDLWLKVKKLSEEECWLFSGFKDSKMGYGQFSVMGVNYPAHVIAYELTKGPVTPGLLVMHLCNVPACCNPSHLKLGTHTENLQYAVYSGSFKAGVSRVVGVRFDSSRNRWIASARFGGFRYNLYQGRDLFEAICQRKSWEAKAFKDFPLQGRL